MARTDREYCGQRRTGTLPEIAREENTICWILMAISGSEAEGTWRNRAIRDIVARTGRRILHPDPLHEAMLARNIVTSSYVARASHGCVCGTITTFGVLDSMAQMPKLVERGSKMMEPYKKPGGRFTEGDRDQF